MRKKSLNPNIDKYISDKTGLAESTVKKNIYLLQKNYATSTINAVAQIYAQSKDISVYRQLTEDDKNSLPNIELEKQVVKVKQNTTKKKEEIKIVIHFDSDDYFIKGHIKEINKAYTKGCYTSVHILARKIIENLIREILTKYFPPNKRENKELYFDINQNRFKDFGIILKNLYDKRGAFDPEKKKIIERLYQLAKKFKDDANDTTHSWYFLILRKKEIDDLNLQAIIELIKILLK
jgi:hypothetical protein